VRAPIDVILSCLGHAYGTYASNYNAYFGLKYIFLHACEASGIIGAHSVAAAVANLSTDDIKDFRRKGVSKEELLGGFPTWRCLELKNTLDPVYHSKIGGDVFNRGDEVW